MGGLDADAEQVQVPIAVKVTPGAAAATVHFGYPEGATDICKLHR